MQYNTNHDKKQSELDKIPIDNLLLIVEIRIII